MHTIILSLRNVAYSFNSDFNIILGIKLFSLSVLSLVLISCGGGGTTSSTPVNSLTLHDPNQAANNQFGETVVQLPNGNIVVVAPNDSSEAENGGAVHLYSPSSATLINSIFGDTENDQLGSDGITALSNSNFVIVSTLDDENGTTDTGSVRLVNGATGIEINALIGDVANDKLGSSSITALGNGHFVVASALDDENGTTDTGSVRLVNGTTGIEINALIGDVANDKLGSSSITALSNNNNNNFVVASALDDENGITNTGSVRLVNGETGAQIGAALTGDVENDNLGSSSITALSNGYFVVASEFDDENGVANTGSVRLVDETGKQIGDALVGDMENDKFGNNSITVLSNNNNNFVIVSRFDDENGITNTGSVRLVNGETGDEINALVGDVANDRLGNNSITALSNGYFVVASEFDDENGITNTGSVRLVNGETGDEINALVGDMENDNLGNNSITTLSNGYFVIVSTSDDENGITNTGSVRLVNGATGEQINALVGDVADDKLGDNSITALSNGHFVVASRFDNENGTTDTGSIRLVNGTTGAQIGTALVGDMAYDKLGDNGIPALSSITALSNGHFVVVSTLDDENGTTDTGSVRLVDGTTGEQIGDAVVGDTADDMKNAQVIALRNGDYYILGLPNADVNGLVDAGSVRIVIP